jgi:NAD(P)-dependent dehydrogenase (short-subunit alcohol dehydrogenase family)
MRFQGKTVLITPGASGIGAPCARRRWPVLEEVAAAIAFLASGEASYVAGQALDVSGGLSMW